MFFACTRWGFGPCIVLQAPYLCIGGVCKAMERLLWYLAV
jgi:hypothetical protein